MADAEGSCHCGTIKVLVISGFGENAEAGICHFFSYIGFVKRDNLRILRGVPKGYKQSPCAAQSGKEVVRYFCGDCGTPLWAAADSAPATYSIKLAIVGNNVPPAREIYWKYAQPWEKPMVLQERLFEEWPE